MWVALNAAAAGYCVALGHDNCLSVYYLMSFLLLIADCSSKSLWLSHPCFLLWQNTGGVSALKPLAHLQLQRTVGSRKSELNIRIRAMSCEPSFLAFTTFLHADPLQNVYKKHKRKSPREIWAFQDPYRRAGKLWQDDHSPEDL